MYNSYNSSSVKKSIQIMIGGALGLIIMTIVSPSEKPTFQQLETTSAKPPFFETGPLWCPSTRDISLDINMRNVVRLNTDD